MSWPMPTSGQWNPGVSQTPSAMMIPDMGNYTQEQWTAMQQQNWQQWAQWQQQYAQWQNQFGDKYAQQMQAMQMSGVASVVPPPPSNAPPPAPPPPDKSPPPPPPHENNQPLFGNPQSQPPPPRNAAQNNDKMGNEQWSYSDTKPSAQGNAEALKKLAEEERLFDIQFQKWEEEIEKWKRENVNHPDKQAYDEYEKKFETCRVQLMERRQQMKQNRAKLLGTAPTTSNNITVISSQILTPQNVSSPLIQDQRHQQQPHDNKGYGDNNTQQTNNANRGAYGDNSQMPSNINRNYGGNQQPANMNRGYGDNTSQMPPNINRGYDGNTPQHTNTNRGYADNNSNQNYNNNRHQPQQPPNYNRGYNDNNLQINRGYDANNTNMPPNSNKGHDDSNRPQNYNNYNQNYNNKNNTQNYNDNMTGHNRRNIRNIELQDNVNSLHFQDSDYDSQNATNFLPSSNANKGIPGLDLVPEDISKPIMPAADVIDITEENNANNKGPDYSTISKGINHILGDAKIMNILSMVQGQGQGASNQNNQQHNTGVYGMQTHQWNNALNNQQFDNNQNQFMQQGQANTNFPPPLMQQNVYPPSQQGYPQGPPPKPMNNDRQFMPQAQRFDQNKSLEQDYRNQNYPNNAGIQVMTANRPMHLGNIIPPVIEPVKPKWEEEPLFEPSVIVEYDHKSLRLKARDFIEPVHTFDYNHKSKDDEYKRKDIEKEVDEELFSRKTRKPEIDDDLPYNRRGGLDRYGREREIGRDYERRPLPRSDNRDDWRSRPPREIHDDRRRPDDRPRDDRLRTDDRPRTDDRNRYEDRPRLDERFERRDDRDRYSRRDDVRRDDMRRDDIRRDDMRRDDIHRDDIRRDDIRRDDIRRDDIRRDDIRDRERDRFRDSRKDDRRSRSRDQDRKRAHSIDSDNASKKSKESSSKSAEPPKHTVMIDDLLEPPARSMRPEKIVIIMRGPPGSGKSYLAKLIRDREADFKSTARILSIDDYFMQESEVEEKDPATGKIVKKPSMKYEYVEKEEESYTTSLKRAFKRTITDGYFNFLIYDAVNDQLKSYADIWNFARQNGFQVYICSLERDPQVCFKRNIHNRSLEEIEVICARFFDTPAHHIQLDATTLLQNAAITEVQMEDVDDDVIMEDAQDAEVETSFTSKWEKMDDASQLARLDGTSKPLRPAVSMEDYLQLDDWQPTTAKPGKKSVRWADLEENRKQEKMRAIGFVVGQTDWNRMTDPTMGSSALTQTKYIERVRRN